MIRFTLAAVLACGTFAFGAAIAPGAADAAKPKLSVKDATRAEPDGFGRQPATFAVSMSRKLNRPVAVSFRTFPGTAGSLDFEPSFGTARIKAGRKLARIRVPVRGDLFAEPEETFSVRLLEPRRARIGDGTGTGTIPANDNGTDTDGDDIPDVDDCAPDDPNPEGRTRCFAPATPYEINSGAVPAGTLVYLEHMWVAEVSDDGRLGFGSILDSSPDFDGLDFSAVELDLSPVRFLIGGDSFVTLFGGVADDGTLTVFDEETGPCCQTTPGTVSLTAAQLAAGADGLNGRRVTVTTGVTITDASPTRWSTDGGFDVLGDMSDLPAFPDGEQFESITGFVRTLGPGTPTISPGGIEDLDPVAPKLTQLQGLDTCLQPGEQDVTIAEVFVDEPVAADTVVQLEAEDGGVISLPASVTIPAGQDSALIAADGVDEGFTEVISTLGPVSDQIGIEVSSVFC